MFLLWSKAWLLLLVVLATISSLAATHSILPVQRAFLEHFRCHEGLTVDINMSTSYM